MNERLIRDYEKMMRDRTRMRAYREAIERVCPGRRVVEVGTGLGPLALMALQAGAARVYGIESNLEVLALATRVIRAAGFDESRFVPIPGLSHQVELPERVEVLLSETVDSTGPGENTLFYTADASRRFLVPGGVHLPRKLRCYAALCYSSHFAEQQAFWKRELSDEFGLECDAVAEELRRHNQSLYAPPEEILSDWQCWLDVRYEQVPSLAQPGPILLEATKAGVLNGVAMTFDLELAEGIHLCNAPQDASTHWRQGFSPFRQPVACGVGDCLWLDVQLEHSDRPMIGVRTRHLHIREPRVLEFIADLERQRTASATAGQAAQALQARARS